MMILVDIYIPAINDTYDFRLDENTKIEEVILEIIEIISKKMQNEKPGKIEKYILCSKEQKRVLPKSKTLRMCNIKDGCQLMLV